MANSILSISAMQLSAELKLIELPCKIRCPILTESASSWRKILEVVSESVINVAIWILIAWIYYPSKVYSTRNEPTEKVSEALKKVFYYIPVIFI